jgi:hypothetical protein
VSENGLFSAQKSEGFCGAQRYRKVRSFFTGRWIGLIENFFSESLVKYLNCYKPHRFHILCHNMLVSVDENALKLVKID